MPTATLGIDANLPMAEVCRRFFSGRQCISMYADATDKKAVGIPFAVGKKHDSYSGRCLFKK